MFFVSASLYVHTSYRRDRTSASDAPCATHSRSDRDMDDDIVRQNDALLSSKCGRATCITSTPTRCVRENAMTTQSPSCDRLKSMCGTFVQGRPLSVRWIATSRQCPTHCVATSMTRGRRHATSARTRSIARTYRPMRVASSAPTRRASSAGTCDAPGRVYGSRCHADTSTAHTCTSSMKKRPGGAPHQTSSSSLSSPTRAKRASSIRWLRFAREVGVGASSRASLRFLMTLRPRWSKSR